MLASCLCEVSVSHPHSNSGIFPQTILEPCKQRRLDFRSVKQTLALASNLCHPVHY